MKRPRKKRIGILGGAFDPIHVGHLILAEEACRQLKLDKVIFIPTNVPPHKPPTIAGARHRLAMVRAACKGNARFEVSRIELDRKGVSYLVDTLEELKKAYGGEVSWYFLSGSDSLYELSKWKDVSRVVRLVYFVAATRPGYPKRSSRYPVKIIKMPSIDISSTRIRGMARSGRSIRYYVPESVYGYIIRKDIYIK